MGNAIDDAKLYALLLGTELLLRSGRRRSERLKRLMQSDDFVFQIQTERGAGGHFTLRNGKLTLRFGHHPQPDFSQRWKSGADAFRVMTSSDESQVLRALEAGDCHMQGNFLVAMWFSEAAKLSRLREPSPRARTA